MSVTNAEVKLQGISKSGGRDGFTLFQAAGLILLTLVVSIGGWYAVGKIFFWSDLDMKRVNQQLQYYKGKVQAEPKNLENRIALGYTYFLKGDNDQAAKEFNQVITLNKKHAPAYFNLGIVYEDEERLDDAMEMYQKSVELSPRDYKGHLQKGIVYRKMKMYKEAVKSLEQANKLMPGRSNIIFEIGRVAEDQAQFKTAAAIYKEALLYDPLYKDAVEALKRVEKKL